MWSQKPCGVAAPTRISVGPAPRAGRPGSNRADIGLADAAADRAGAANGTALAIDLAKSPGAGHSLPNKVMGKFSNRPGLSRLVIAGSRAHGLRELIASGRLRMRYSYFLRSH